MRRVLLASVGVLLPSSALANAPEIAFGASARTNAMGGAGTASSADGDAAYHNPAALSRCPDSHVTGFTQRYHYALDVDRTGADAPAGGMRPMPDQTRAGMSACLRLPRDLTIGTRFATSIESLSTIDVDTLDPTPMFPLYGRPIEYMSIQFGAAWQPVPEIALGVGASMLVSTDLSFSTNVPVGVIVDGNLAELGFDINVNLQPRMTPYLGVLVRPTDDLYVGLTYRGALSHNLSMPISIVTTVLEFTFPIPMNLDVDTWYSPRSISVGGAYRATPKLELTADFTIYDYRARRALLDDSVGLSAPDPYLDVTPGNATGSIVGLLIALPTADAPNYRASYALRMGGELTVLDGRLAFRAGYGVRTAALPLPGARNTTLLDGTVHSLSAGMGIAFGDGWSRDRVEADATPALYEGEVARPRMSYRLDTFGRLGVMVTREDAIKDIRWGGVLFDLGGSFTVGWR